MSRRGRSGGGGLFGDSGPEDAVPEDDTLPELDELLHAHGPKRRTSSRAFSRGAFRSASPYAFSPRFATRRRVGGRTWVLWLRICVYSLLLLFSLVGLVTGIAQASSSYTDAGIMANAPVCASSVDLTTTSENCVGTMNLVAEYGVVNDGDEESVGLDLPSIGRDLPPADSVWVSFPGDAQFDAAVGDGPSVVRAEFWEGQIVTLTAGAQGVSATTDQNPNNNGGTGLGIAFMSFSFVLLSILLFIGIRALRLRWLHPGIAQRLIVSVLPVWFLGFFIAGVCLANQPALVAPVLAIAPAVTAVFAALVWLVAAKGRKSQLRPAYRYR
jgi:hypothetical protein